MYDIDALEQQWERYRRKRVLRIVAIAAGVVILLAVPTLYVTQMSGKSVEANRGTKQSNPAAGTQGPRQGNALAAADQENRKPLQPGAPSMGASGPQSQKRKMNIRFSDQYGEAEEVSEMSKKKIELEMTDAENREVVKEIEARFPATQDYDDAIYLAKYYYGKRQYQKAETWAMRANGIDSSQEESWLLYGKAKANQGYRAEALRILQVYYDQSGSVQAKMLIDRIRKGKKF